VARPELLQFFARRIQPHIDDDPTRPSANRAALPPVAQQIMRAARQTGVGVSGRLIMAVAG